jgi:hypothetical protein
LWKRADERLFLVGESGLLGDALAEDGAVERHVQRVEQGWRLGLGLEMLEQHQPGRHRANAVESHEEHGARHGRHLPVLRVGNRVHEAQQLLRQAVVLEDRVGEGADRRVFRGRERADRPHRLGHGGKISTLAEAGENELDRRRRRRHDRRIAGLPRSR